MKLNLITNEEKTKQLPPHSLHQGKACLPNLVRRLEEWFHFIDECSKQNQDVNISGFMADDLLLTVQTIDTIWRHYIWQDNIDQYFHPYIHIFETSHHSYQTIRIK
jgi:hypothetical protein